MSFLSDVKLSAQIFGLVILIITLILILRRLLTNNTSTNAQIQQPRQYPNDSCECQPCLTLQDNACYVS